jgi:hypothetical protein
VEREGLSLTDVSKVIFAGEISPSEMWKLLVNATYVQGSKEEGDTINEGDTIIGMGPRLAELCLAAYGGHFLRVKDAIGRLNRNESQFSASSHIPCVTSRIIDCLDTHARTRPLLKAMAKFGFAPIATPDNAAVEMIAKLGIGGVVERESKCMIFGLPETKWDGTNSSYALIPSTESMRLTIARTLNARRLRA